MRQLDFFFPFYDTFTWRFSRNSSVNDLSRGRFFGEVFRKKATRNARPIEDIYPHKSLFVFFFLIIILLLLYISRNYRLTWATIKFITFNALSIYIISAIFIIISLFSPYICMYMCVTSMTCTCP